MGGYLPACDRCSPMAHAQVCSSDPPGCFGSTVLEGEADTAVTVASLPARGRPPQAAARRAGLEFVEKLLTTNLTSADTTERNAGMLRVRSSHRWSRWLLALAPRGPGRRYRVASSSRYGLCARRPRWPSPGDADSDSTAGSASATLKAAGTANAATAESKKTSPVGALPIPLEVDRLVLKRPHGSLPVAALGDPGRRGGRPA
jgi:hypothetical protein